MEIKYENYILENDFEENFYKIYSTNFLLIKHKISIQNKKQMINTYNHQLINSLL